MNPRQVVLAFAVGVVALAAGAVGGAVAHQFIGSGYEVAVGVVDAPSGVVLTTPSPAAPPTTAPPSPTEAPTPSVTPTPTEPPTPVPPLTPVETVTPFPTFGP